jgi:hypothetical protein
MTIFRDSGWTWDEIGSWFQQQNLHGITCSLQPREEALSNNLLCEAKCLILYHETQGESYFPLLPKLQSVETKFQHNGEDQLYAPFLVPFIFTLPIHGPRFLKPSLSQTLNYVVKCILNTAWPPKADLYIYNTLPTSKIQTLSKNNPRWYPQQ